MSYLCEANRLNHKIYYPEFNSIKLLCCDIDGVMTNGGLYYDSSGQVMLKFSVLDGLGLQRVQESGVKTCFISMSDNEIIKQRAKKLGVDYCFVGISEKKEVINQLIQELDIKFENVAHIADDINDLELLSSVGFPVTVPHAMEDIKQLSKYMTSRSGGNGAVRELCEAIIAAKK